MNDTIGIFYELPDGRIAKTYAWNGSTNTINYYFNDDLSGRTTSEDEWMSWIPRRDLMDFDVSLDHKLPHAFSLLWNLHSWSHLKEAIASNHPDLTEIRSAMKKHNLEEEKIMSIKTKT